MYKVLAGSSFQSGSILKQYVQNWVDKLFDNLKSYQYTFCQYPKVKNEQYGMVYFYNKDKSRFVRMTAKEEAGTWRIKVIEYFPADQAEINRLWKLKGDCASKPNLVVEEKTSHSIGDIVEVKYFNVTLKAKINKKDTKFDNRYFITFLKSGKSQWMNDEQFSLSSDKSSTQKEETELKQSDDKQDAYKVGDHVGVKTRSGTMKGKIVKFSGSKVLIKWDDAGYQDMWTSTNNLVKI